MCQRALTAFVTLFLGVLMSVLLPAIPAAQGEDDSVFEDMEPEPPAHKPHAEPREPTEEPRPPDADEEPTMLKPDLAIGRIKPAEDRICAEVINKELPSVKQKIRVSFYIYEEEDGRINHKHIGDAWLDGMDSGGPESDGKWACLETAPANLQKHLFVHVDPKNAIAETNDENNTKKYEMTPQIAPAGALEKKQAIKKK